MATKKSTEISYPIWKTIIWRFVRAGLSGGITSLLLVQVMLKPDYSNLQLWAYSLSSAFLTGFISAGALALREYLSESKSDPIQKIPL